MEKFDFDELKSELKLKLLESFENSFLPSIESWLAIIKGDYQRLYELFSKYEQLKNNESDHTRSELLKSLDEILKAIHSKFNENNLIVFEKLAEVLQRQTDSYNSSLIIPQVKERYYSQENDGVFLKFSKLLKRTLFNFTKIPIRLLNLFRKKRVIQYWNHTIPLNNLICYHLSIKLSRLFIYNYDDINKEIVHWLYPFKTKTDQFVGFKNSGDSSSYGSGDFQKLINEATSKYRSLFEKILDQKLEDFENDFYKVGTIELSSKKFKQVNILKQHREALKSSIRLQDKWSNAFKAFIGDWESDVEIYKISFQTKIACDKLIMDQNSRFISVVKEPVDQIKKTLEKYEEILSSGKENLSKRLKTILYQAKKELDQKLIPDICASVTSQSFNNSLNRLENSIENYIEQLPQKHIIADQEGLESGLNSKELHEISLSELISFEILTAFKQQIKLAKNDLFLSVEEATVAFLDLDNIILFGTNTAIDLLEQGKPEEECIEVLKDSISRSYEKLDSGINQIEEALVDNNNKITDAVKTFNEDILLLTENEKISELNLRLVKAKTLQQAKEVRGYLLTKSRKAFQELKTALITGLNKSRSAFNFVRSRFILTAKKPVLSREVSDFLLEAQQVINELPSIYRQLYKIEPLDDLILFEGRENELRKLRTAYENFLIGRYSSVILIGERWGGQTTFLNYAIRNIDFKNQIKRIKITREINDETKLLKVLSDSLEIEDLKSLDQLSNLLKEGRKRIIIIEDIQKLFERRIGGFELLNKFLKLVSQTSRDTFWIVSITQYAWGYLNKAIHMSDLFSYPIQMEPLTDKQLIEIIHKRNRISGFEIIYEPTEEDLSSKKYLAMNPKQQQEKLKKEYFEKLCSFAKNNVSMALNYWLLSTQSIDKKTIKIGAFAKPELRSLSMLSSDKIYLLNALIIHDGLNSSQLAQVLNLTANTCELLLLSLQEDSLIIRDNEQFVVNPLIYRDCLNVLKSKNLLHFG